MHPGQGQSPATVECNHAEAKFLTKQGESQNRTLKNLELRHSFLSLERKFGHQIKMQLSRERLQRRLLQVPPVFL